MKSKVSEVKAQETVAEESNTPSESSDTKYTPALWKVEHNGVTSYLFGSIHMGDASMYPLPKAVTDAYESTEALAVEIDMANVNQMEMAQKVQQLGMDPNYSLESVLKEDTLTEYKEYCEETKAPCAMFNTFEPWLTAITLESINMQKSGYSDKYGIDMHFLNQARDNKEIIELETVDSQLNMLDGMSLSVQDAFLLSVVSREGDDTQELVEAWKTGNVEEYLQTSFEDAKEIGLSGEDYNTFIDDLLYKRNKGMAEGLAKQFEQGKAIFAVVGAAHYGGDKSVNHYLEELGFNVERVNYE